MGFTQIDPKLNGVRFGCHIAIREDTALAIRKNKSFRITSINQLQLIQLINYIMTI